MERVAREVVVVLGRFLFIPGVLRKVLGDDIDALLHPYLGLNRGSTGPPQPPWYTCVTHTFKTFLGAAPFSGENRV